jgi:hypothetical protein
MSYDTIRNVGYVSYDGNYGAEADLLMFDRYEYVEAVFNNKDLTEWEG